MTPFSAAARTPFGPRPYTVVPWSVARSASSRPSLGRAGEPGPHARAGVQQDHVGRRGDDGLGGGSERGLVPGGHRADGRAADDGGPVALEVLALLVDASARGDADGDRHPAAMPHEPANASPGSSTRRSVPDAKALAGHVIGSTARARRACSGPSPSPVKTWSQRKAASAQSVVLRSGPPSVARMRPSRVGDEAAEAVVERDGADRAAPAEVEPGGGDLGLPLGDRPAVGVQHRGRREREHVAVDDVGPGREVGVEAGAERRGGGAALSPRGAR